MSAQTRPPGTAPTTNGPGFQTTGTGGPLMFSNQTPTSGPGVGITETPTQAPTTVCATTTRWSNWVNRNKPGTGTGDFEVHFFFYKHFFF